MLCPCADQESIKNDQFRGHTPGFGRISLSRVIAEYLRVPGKQPPDVRLDVLAQGPYGHGQPAVPGSLEQLPPQSHHLVCIRAMVRLGEQPVDAGRPGGQKEQGRSKRITILRPTPMLGPPTLLDQKFPGSPPAFGRLVFIRQQVSKAGHRQSVGTAVGVRFVLEGRIPGRQQGIEPVEESLPLFGGRLAGHSTEQAHRRKCGQAGMAAIFVARIGPIQGELLGDRAIGKIDQVGDCVGSETRPGQAESNPFNQIGLPRRCSRPWPA